MRGIYFSQINTEAVYQGAVQKVFNEIKAFEKMGFEMKHVNFAPVSKGFRKTFLGKGIASAIPFTYVFSKYEYSHDYDNYDFYYFRFEAADFWFTRFLKKLKSNNPSSKIIVEFPDFPNTFWLNTVFHIPLLFKDYAARRKYVNCVDRFAVLNEEYKNIYGVDTLNYRNGIDVDKVPRRNSASYSESEIHIVCVSTMFPVHGYDRILEGMYIYYLSEPERKIVFHIVGDGPGPELSKYRKMVGEKKLQDYVIFEGRQTGDKLTEIIDSCDIAADVFGGYRKKLEMTSSLKTREYLARGIPIISGCEVDVLKDTGFKYILMYPNNDSPVDMDKIVEFNDVVYSQQSREEVSNAIREFAYKNCSTEVTMKKVIDYIKG